MRCKYLSVVDIIGKPSVSVVVNLSYLDISSPGLGAIVDHALAYVVTSNKESSHHLISLEYESRSALFPACIIQTFLTEKLALKMSRRSPVYLYGPSSKVRAISPWVTQS